VLVTTLYWTLLLDNACALLSHHHRIEQLFWPIASPIGLSDFCAIVLTLMSTVAKSHTAPLHFGRWWRWALVSPDGVAPSRMVSVSASVNLPLHHKSRSSLLAPAHPGGPGKRAVKRLCMCASLHFAHYAILYTDIIL